MDTKTLFGLTVIPVGFLGGMLAAFLAALLLRLVFRDYFGPRNPLLFFTIATLLVHFFFGLAPALAIAPYFFSTRVSMTVPMARGMNASEAPNTISPTRIFSGAVTTIVLICG